MGVNIVIIAPDFETASALYDVAPANLLPPLDKGLQAEDGRYSWIHWDWPKGFTAKATKLGCKVMDWKDGQGQHWAAKESFVGKAAALDAARAAVEAE